LLLLYNSAFSS
jgi:hypothetical protein